MQPARVSSVGSNKKRCGSGKGRGTRDFPPAGFGYQYVDIERRLKCRIAARQMSGEESLTTTAMLEILCGFLRAVVHGHFAFGEWARHSGWKNL